MWVCAHECSALGAQKRSADPRAGVGGSYEPVWVSRRAVNTLNHSVIFLAPNFLKIHKQQRYSCDMVPSICCSCFYELK